MQKLLKRRSSYRTMRQMKRDRALWGANEGTLIMRFSQEQSCVLWSKSPESPATRSKESDKDRGDRNPTSSLHILFLPMVVAVVIRVLRISTLTILIMMKAPEKEGLMSEVLCQQQSSQWSRSQPP